MRDMLARVGQPRVSTTTVEPPKQKLDIGSLIMMLMMQGMFQGKGAQGDVSTLDAMPSPDSWASVPDSLGPEAVPGLTPDYSGNPAQIPGMAQLGGQMSGLTPEMLFKVLLGMRGR
jgi:hypothetical protein